MNVAVERAVKEGAKIGAGAWGAIKVSGTLRGLLLELISGWSVSRRHRRFQDAATSLHSDARVSGVLEKGRKGQGEAVRVGRHERS